MLRIAVCDDELEELSHLTRLLDQYRLEERVDLEYTAFQSPLELIAAMESGIHYNALLLDILMGGMSGMDAAREIRELDQAVLIVFLTSSPEFAVQAFSVDALFYQLKPVNPENFRRVMERILAHTAHEREETLLLKTKAGLQRLPLQQLEYCESIGKSMFYHMVSGVTLPIPHGKYGPFRERFLSYLFEKAHVL